MAVSQLLSRNLKTAKSAVRRLHWRINSHLADRVNVSTPQGKFTVYTADCSIGWQLFVNREFESDWVATVLEFLRSSGRLPAKGKGTIIDIGANLGMISIGMLLQNEFAQAIAIEADPRNFSLLEHNVRQNNLDPKKFRCVHRAASNTKGELEFELSQHNFGDHRVRLKTEPQGPRGRVDRFEESSRNTIRVPAEPLDQILSDLNSDATNDISLVWIDTQGHEGFVFQGAKNLLTRDIPVVCEIWPYGLTRSGMSHEQFFQIAREFWTSYWVQPKDSKLQRYDTAMLPQLFKELGDSGEFVNAIFTK
jgi:FkbM family methyltransferase